MSTGENVDTGNSGLIFFCVVIVMLVAWCAINACNQGKAEAQQQNGGPQTGERDGDMVVLDGGQVAEAVVDIQPGCCCGGGGGGDGGDGGGCGGCGGD